MNEFLEAAWKAYQIKRSRDRIQRLSNKRDKDREAILAEKKRLLELLEPAPLTGQNVAPESFKAGEY
jgi:hypothetical protein